MGRPFPERNTFLSKVQLSIDYLFDSMRVLEIKSPVGAVEALSGI